MNKFVCNRCGYTFSSPSEKGVDKIKSLHNQKCEKKPDITIPKMSQKSQIKTGDFTQLSILRKKIKEKIETLNEIMFRNNEDVNKVVFSKEKDYDLLEKYFTAVLKSHLLKKDKINVKLEFKELLRELKPKTEFKGEYTTEDLEGLYSLHVEFMLLRCILNDNILYKYISDTYKMMQSIVEIQPSLKDWLNFSKV